MGMVEVKPPFCLIATLSPIISVLIKTVLVVSFRNPTQSVRHSLKEGREQSLFLCLFLKSFSPHLPSEL